MTQPYFVTGAEPVTPYQPSKTVDAIGMLMILAGGFLLYKLVSMK